MGDIDFDELDRAVGKLMSEREQSLQSKKAKSVQNTSASQSDGKLKVNVAPKKSAPITNSRVRYMDFVPKRAVNNITTRPVSVAKPIAKPVVKQNLNPIQKQNVNEFVNTVKEKIEAESIKEAPIATENTENQPRIALARRQRTGYVGGTNNQLLNHKDSPAKSNFVKLDDEKEEVKIFNPKKETVVEASIKNDEEDRIAPYLYDDKPVVEEKSIENKPSEKQVEYKPVAPKISPKHELSEEERKIESTTPFIEQPKIKKRPLGSPEIGLVEDIANEPSVRSREVIRQKDTAPIYQTNAKLPVKEKSNVWKYILWAIALILIGVGLGVLLFQNPFNWNLPF